MTTKKANVIFLIANILLLVLAYVYYQYEGDIIPLGIIGAMLLTSVFILVKGIRKRRK